MFWMWCIIYTNLHSWCFYCLFILARTHHCVQINTNGLMCTPHIRTRTAHNHEDMLCASVCQQKYRWYWTFKHYRWPVTPEALIKLLIIALVWLLPVLLWKSHFTTAGFDLNYQWWIQEVALVSAETPTERARAPNQWRLISWRAKITLKHG